METTQFDIKKEIHDLNTQITDLRDMLFDYKRMAAGDYTREEIEKDISDLILERNKLLIMLRS